MDDLLDYVRHEVAMDGDDGTPVDRLDSFIETYYSREASLKGDSAPSQKIDDTFKDFVWKQLATLPELTVAFLRKIEEEVEHHPSAGTPAVEAPPPEQGTDTNTGLPIPQDGMQVEGETAAVPDASTPAPPPIASTSSAILDDQGNPIDQDRSILKNKAKIKAARKDPNKKYRDARISGPQFQFVQIPDEDIVTSTRQQLREKYGDTLRIAADPETCYVALTGSHERFGKLTPLCYQILQAIARGRDDGKTVVELGQEFDHDQKSLFHFVKSLVELNLIIKMRIFVTRTQTSRCIHRHYLETSKHWATRMTKDPGPETATGADDEDDMSRTTPLTLLTVAHLNSNEPLIRSRILNALKKAPENLLPYANVSFAIGFHARPVKQNGRRLNRIITTMETQGLIQKVGVARQGSRGLLPCIKLPESAIQEAEVIDSTQSEEEEVEERPNILTTLPVERQAIDLFVSAGAQGLTIRELQAGLGDVGTRILETLLIRLEKNHEPPHLCDYRIMSVFETYGREKRLRYFTTAGYHERCRLDGIGEMANLNDFTHPELAGGFSVTDASEFYASPEDFATRATTMQTSTKYIVRSTKSSKAKQKIPGQPVKRGRPKGSKTKKEKEGTVQPPDTGEAILDEGTAQSQEQGDMSKEDKSPAKRGRPKKERPEGEDGQPPKKKGRPRKTPLEGEEPSVPKKLGRPRKVPVDGQEPPQPKKKGRPRKSQPPQEGQPDAVATAQDDTLAKNDMAGTPADTPTAGGSAAEPPAEAAATAGNTPDPSAAVTPNLDLNSIPDEAQTIARKRTTSLGGHERDATEKKRAKKVKVERDPNQGPPIKGRPRKYPPGTTSSQRRVLLEERRAAGLEPPAGAKKNRKGGSKPDGLAPGTGSTAPSAEGTPVSEDTLAGLLAAARPQSPLTLENGQDDQSAVPTDTFQPSEPRVEEQALSGSVPDVLARRSRSHTSIVSHSEAPPVKLESSGNFPLETPINEKSIEDPNAVAAVADDPMLQADASIPEGTAPLPPKKRGRPRKSVAPPVPAVAVEEVNNGTQPVAPENVDKATSAGESLEVDSSASALVSQPELASIESSASQAPKRRGRPRKSIQAEAAHLEEPRATPHTLPLEQAILPEVPTEDAAEEDTSLRRSGRARGSVKSIGRAASPRPRRGRSSKIMPSDMDVKTETVPDVQLDRLTTAPTSQATPAEYDTREVAGEWSASSETFTAKDGGSLGLSEARPGPVSGDDASEPQGTASADGNTEEADSAAVLQKVSSSEHAPLQENAESSALPELPAPSPAGSEEISTPLSAQTREDQSVAANAVPTPKPTPLVVDGQAAPEVRPEPEGLIATHQQTLKQIAPLDDSPAKGASDAGVDDVPLVGESRSSTLKLPPMPEPLPSTLPEGNLDSGPSSYDVAPNVVARPAAPEMVIDSAPDRRNHSMQIHQNEYISTLQEAGGIAEEGLPLNKLWQEYMQRKNPSKPMPRPLDRRTVKILATVLEKRGLVKRSTLQFQTYEGKMVQRPVIYLAHITLDSPAMRDFAIAMQEKVETPIAGAKNWLKKRQTLIETDEMAVAPVAKRRGRKPAEQIPITPRPYFLKNWRIVAQYFGWQYGFLARTRTLHQHLIASITDDNDSPFIISSEPRTRIFSTPFVLLETPLSIFMQISAVSEYSEALEQFLQTEDPTKVAMKDLPGELSTLLASKKTKGYSRFSQLFHALIVLKLLVPVEQVEYKTPIVAYSGREREPRYFGAKEDGSTATYWLLLSQAPLYDLQEREEKEQKLLGQLPVITVEEATQYWETLQGLTFNSVDVQSLPKATVKYPPTLNASSTFIHAARTAAHWRPQYALLAQQKTYLRRTLAEVASKNDLLADENKLKELAFNVCAPMDIVRAYLAKPQHGAVPEWAKKRKRRSAIAQKSSVSDTSASEPEGPGAPRPRSQATGEAILERKRAQKAARHAARVRMQQQIIARKAQGAREAKEAVWDGIVNGFRMLHGEDALKVVQLDFLHTWFMSSDGPTATTIQQHLEQAVEGVSTSFVDFSARSSLASKTGSIGNRAEKQRMKNVPRRPKSMIVPSMPHGEEISLHAMPDLPEVISSAEKKTGKTGWTPEEDEQLIDLYVILQSRANDRDTKLVMEPAIAFYPGTKAKTLLDRLRRLALTPGEVAYMDALQDAWSRLWHEGRVRDPLLHDAARNVTKEGLLLLRRVLNGALNKQSLRFQAIMPPDAAATSQTGLPIDPNELNNEFILEYKTSLGDPDAPQTWEYLSSMVTTAQKTAIYRYQPFCTAYNTGQTFTHLTSEDRAREFQTRYRRLDTLPSNYIKDAEAFERRLADEGEIEWSPICEDGDMLALTQLFSENLISISVDTSVTRAGRPYTDYRTRKIDDEKLENTVLIKANEKFLKRTEPFLRSALTVAIPTETSMLDKREIVSA